MRKDSIFYREPEKMSRLVKWVFGLPLAYALYLVLGLLLPNVNSLTTALRYALLTICVLAVGKYFLNFSVKSFFSDKQFGNKKLVKGFVTMTVVSVITTFVWFLFDKDNFAFTFKGLDSVKSWLMQLPLLVFGVISEELIFRSYIGHVVSETYLEKPKSKVICALVSAALFTIAHFMNPEVAGPTAIWAMTFYFVFGFALMLIAQKENGIEKTMGIHFANNLFCAIFVSYENAVVSTSAIFSHSNSIGPMLITQAVVCLIACIVID